MKMTHIEIEHPGIMLKEDFLNDLGIKPATLAKSIGKDKSAITKILAGKQAITADMSLRLGIFFGMSEGFWFNLQKDYELRTAKRERLVQFKETIQPYKVALA